MSKSKLAVFFAAFDVDHTVVPRELGNEKYPELANHYSHFGQHELIVWDAVGQPYRLVLERNHYDSVSFRDESCRAKIKERRGELPDALFKILAKTQYKKTMSKATAKEMEDDDFVSQHEMEEAYFDPEAPVEQWPDSDPE